MSCWWCQFVLAASGVPRASPFRGRRSSRNPQPIYYQCMHIAHQLSKQHLKCFDGFFASMAFVCPCAYCNAHKHAIMFCCCHSMFAFQVFLALRPSEADAVLAIRSRLKTNACTPLTSLQTTVRRLCFMHDACSCTSCTQAR
jgi:hypothetical protein